MIPSRKQCPKGCGTLKNEMQTRGPLVQTCVICGYVEYPSYPKRVGSEDEAYYPRQSMSKRQRGLRRERIKRLILEDYTIGEVGELTGYSIPLIKQVAAKVRRAA
jgi:hypothetical protein